MQKVIFACVHNAGRSQMSAAFFNQLVDPKRALAISAGTQPAEHVHPVVVEINSVRQTRDEIRRRVLDLLARERMTA
jgi:protein-tyrosine-phosphatase